MPPLSVQDAFYDGRFLVYLSNYVPMPSVPNTSHDNMDDYLYSMGFSSANFNKHKMFVKVALQIRAVTRRNRSFSTTPHL